MAVFLNGQKMAKPLMNGVVWNALYNGRRLWATPADTVTGVEILASDGSPAPTVLSIGGSVKLAARATYADGHVGDLLTSEHVFFRSLDDSVATVSGNTVTWKHGGTALITAKVGGFTSAVVSIASAYAPESIRVTDDSGQPVDAVTLRVGESRNLKVTVLARCGIAGVHGQRRQPGYRRGWRRETDRHHRHPGIVDIEGGRDSQPERQHPAGLRAAGIRREHPRQDHRNHQQ